MPSYTEAASKAGDRVIAALGSAQDRYISAVSTVSQTIGGYIPELPALPLTDKIPSPAEIVETTFDLWQQALKSQKEYALDLLKAVAPVTEKVAPAVKMSKPRRKAPATKTTN